MAVAGMRGLSLFISDIRNCQNKEQERQRVDKELANIRTRFKSERTLTPYEKKKYVWKMLYIYMLGYDVDFGHMEAVALISAPKYAEKQVGYIVTSCLLNENHDFLRLVINTVRNDIIGRNETFQCLALNMVGNVGGKEFSESLAPDVQKLLVSSTVRPLVRKKAALCLLRLYRKNADVVTIEGWAEKMAALLDEKDLGVLTAVMSLLVALVAGSPDQYWLCVPKCVRVLERMTRSSDVPQEYTYYGIPSPWLQVKTMRVLQYFPAIEDPSLRRSLFEVLQRILMGTDVVKNVNKNNAAHAVLFEALALVMHHLDAEREMLAQCVVLLAKFISVREPNIRYLGLENMARMLQVADVAETIKRHQAQIVSSLKDADISIRRRALDLLYGLCDHSNARDIVDELLLYLSTAEFAIREELALKTAILAEKFAPDLSWYVDVILQLIEKAGDFVSDDIWHRVVQIVTNNEDLQAYAAAKAVAYMSSKGAGGVHETMCKAGAYLLGEYSHLLARQPGCSPKEVFALLHDKFPTVSTTSKALFLSAYAKILCHTQPPDAELQESVLSVFRRHESNVDAEVQQRAVEYLALGARGPAMADVLAEMPKFPERQSALEKQAAQDTEGDAPEASAAKLRQQAANSQAIVLVTPPAAAAANGIALPPMPSPPPPPPLPQDGSEGPVLAAAAPQPQAEHVAVAPAAAAVSSSSSSSRAADLLGELLAIEAPPPPPPPGGAPVPPPPPQQQQQTDEPLALALYEAQPALNPSVQPVGDVDLWFRSLVLKDSGVLYEDPNLQIGVKADWRGAQGRITLFVGNKATAAVSLASFAVGPAAGLRLLLAPVPPSIPPRAQVQVPLDVAAVHAPTQTPLLHLTYTTVPTQPPVSVRLRLPVVLSKFLHPGPVVPDDFFAQWKMLVGPPQKLQQVMRGVRPMSLQAMAEFLVSVRINIAAGLDPNVNNLVAATAVVTESGPPCQILARVETDPADRTQLRLTVASPDPAAALSLVEFLKEQLLDKDAQVLLRQEAAAAAAPPPPLAALPAPSTFTGSAAGLGDLI
eukprot:jgi/Mesen1/10460/ME000082S09968